MLYDREKMMEMLNNPLFRQANKDLVKQIERELKEEEAEKKVREYLKEHPGASYAKVILDTQVDLKILEDLIDQGRVDMRITSKDLKELEGLKREVLEGLAKVGRNLADKDFSIKKMKQNIADEKAADTKASGMYSQKDNLNDLRKKK